MNIDSAGEVVACCFSDFSMGNVLVCDIEETWNNVHFARLRDNVNKPEKCRYCVESPSGGICCPRIQELSRDHSE
jgi:sulfatase maturation enzyme AslB (radical SAM superfamily)